VLSDLQKDGDTEEFCEDPTIGVYYRPTPKGMDQMLKWKSRLVLAMVLVPKIAHRPG